ncbi:glycosyltransferase family 2 protein, partial [Francisella tularensis subsp. holarctica]|nr:glycosyltransferase family 2 protein [Francisella tularensis subsp. holarctica]
MFFYCLSLACETFACIYILLLILCFVFYLFITYKSRNFNLITSMYVVLSFAFVVCATKVLLSVDYSTHPFISMLILFVLLP